MYDEWKMMCNTDNGWAGERKFSIWIREKDNVTEEDIKFKINGMGDYNITYDIKEYYSLMKMVKEHNRCLFNHPKHLEVLINMAKPHISFEHYVIYTEYKSIDDKYNKVLQLKELGYSASVIADYMLCLDNSSLPSVYLEDEDFKLHYLRTNFIKTYIDKFESAGRDYGTTNLYRTLPTNTKLNEIDRVNFLESLNLLINKDYIVPNDITHLLEMFKLNNINYDEIIDSKIKYFLTKNYEELNKCDFEIDKGIRIHYLEYFNVDNTIKYIDDFYSFYVDLSLNDIIKHKPEITKLTNSNKKLVKNNIDMFSDNIKYVLYLSNDIYERYYDLINENEKAYTLLNINIDTIIQELLYDAIKDIKNEESNLFHYVRLLLKYNGQLDKKIYLTKIYGRNYAELSANRSNKVYYDCKEMIEEELNVKLNKGKSTIPYEKCKEIIEKLFHRDSEWGISYISNNNIEDEYFIEELSKMKFKKEDVEKLCKIELEEVLSEGI